MQSTSLSISLALAALLASVVPAGAAHAACVGDCNNDGLVTVDELVHGVNIALGELPLSGCPAFDADSSGDVTVNELIVGVSNAVNVCPSEATPTMTPTPTTSPTPTATLEQPVRLKVGVAAIKLTPCGDNPDWDGPVTPSGVWGETFTDTNGNGRWDPGEKFVDDPVNTQLDPKSKNKYDGIFMAGFGSNRVALGCHDDLWARALIIEWGYTKVAMVSVDFVGEIDHGTYYGFAHAQELVDPSLGITAFIYSSTHDHEGPDTLGLWGASEFLDGKFPHYLQFVDKEIARAINTAAAPGAMQPVHVVAAQTTPADSPGLRGLQTRTGCRPPFFFDEELRALQFIGDDNATVATLVNWSTHPESLESDNVMVTSDFPNFIRQRVERDLGGTAVYFTGDLGSVEIVGDTCIGGANPHLDDGTNPFDARNPSFDRTQMIGELVGDAVVNALQTGGEPLAVGDVRDSMAHYNVAGTNDQLNFANLQGILDLDMNYFSLDKCPAGTVICVPVDQHLLTFADSNGMPLMQLITAPGEIFPELIYGVADHGRTDCPAANTGLPYEPSVRDAMAAKYRLVVGLSPAEFGYIVPGYDFYKPISIDEEASDVCVGQNYDPTVPRRTVPTHYHESLSVGVDMAASATCYALKLMGLDAQAAANAACQRILQLP